MRARWMRNIRQLLLSMWSEGVALPPSLPHITTEAQWCSLVLTAGGATLSFRYHDHNTSEQATWI